jgi:uncharacterized protein (TIGR02300 family)
LAKPEWGFKRQCHSCGLRFYDLRKDPIVCPHCRATFDALAMLRPRRARAEAVAAAPVVVEEPAPAEEAEAVPETMEEDDDEIIEDASELGEDEEVPELEDGEAEEEP